MNKSTKKFHLPPEWCDQSGVMLTWPHRESDWLKFLPQVEKEFVSIAREIAQRQNLIISCYTAEHLAHVNSLLKEAHLPFHRIKLYIVAADDTWSRDHGPLTVMDENDKPVLLDFTFNGWGQKFTPYRDNQVTRNLHGLGAFAGTPIESIDLVLEGGSIEVDGEGTLMTTSSCLLSKTRNPHLGRLEVEEKLRDHLGVKNILWLERGYLAGDDTDGHIDTLARFTGPQTICHVHCDDPDDEHFTEINAMVAELQNFRDSLGRPYHLVPLPWPSPKFNAEGKRLPATYANFLIINGAVLVPTYDDPADKKALAQIQLCFPDREVVGVSCRTLIEQGGSLHCVTMQLPKGVHL